MKKKLTLNHNQINKVYFLMYLLIVSKSFFFQSILAKVLNKNSSCEFDNDRK